MVRRVLGWLLLGLGACGSSLPCKPAPTDHAERCEPGDWEWAAWGSCCRIQCGADGRWHSPQECVFAWCGPAGAVEFDLKSAELRERVDSIAERLSRMSGEYYVVGFADPLERDEVPGLDLRRAEAYRDALVDAGVCEQRLIAVGGGVLRQRGDGNRYPWGGVGRLVMVTPASTGQFHGLERTPR